MLRKERHPGIAVACVEQRGIAFNEGVDVEEADDTDEQAEQAAYENQIRGDYYAAKGVW